MSLWTEYEGVTIDSSFPLRKLLQPEGRSAFFSTSNENGESVLIRIIECHFDEDEILARWRGVQALGHPNFLRIDRFGQFHTQIDDVTAVYAVFERVDANLGEVLQQGHLSPADASQIGFSVASALETLHANGFVHEHVEVRNIYAVGDQVRLRSDCIREAPEGEAGVEARRRDAQGLAVVLTQVLLGVSGGSLAQGQPSLPAPFDEIWRNSMSGSWGLAGIKAALGQRDPHRPRPQKATPPDTASIRSSAPAAQASSVSASGSTRRVSPVPPSDKPAPPEPELDRSASPGPVRAARAGLPPNRPGPMELPVIFGISEHDLRRWLAAVALLLGVVLVGWFALHRLFNHRAGAAVPPVSAQAGAVNAQPAPAPPSITLSPAAPAPRAGPQSSLDWRVVVFTYNRRDQAQNKVSSLARRHPGLQPAIFSPTGRAPWLVTIGGMLQRDAAYALARKARSLGLPRDTYAQNYRAR